MADTFTVLKSILIVSIFYSIAINIYIASAPADFLVASQIATTPEFGAESLTTIEDSLTSQTSLPLIDLGALIFYSGNIVIDLFVNFITALPQLAVLILDGILSLFPISPDIVTQIKVFIQSVLTGFYILGIIRMIQGSRSGGGGLQ